MSVHTRPKTMGGLWEGYWRGVGRVHLRLPKLKPTRPANCWAIKPYPSDKNPIRLPNEGTKWVPGNSVDIMTHFPECNPKKSRSHSKCLPLPLPRSAFLLAFSIFLAKHHETDPFLNTLVAQTWRLVDLHGRSPFLGRVQKKTG